MATLMALWKRRRLMSNNSGTVGDVPDAQVGSAMAQEKSELLALLNQRKAWEGKEHVQPKHKEHVLHDAASRYARASDSDPFAYARIHSHMRQGFELPSDIVHDANAALARRSGEKRDEFTKLEGIKRKLDEERAWNQHRASMFEGRKKAA